MAGHRLRFYDLDELYSSELTARYVDSLQLLAISRQPPRLNDGRKNLVYNLQCLIMVSLSLPSHNDANPIRDHQNCMSEVPQVYKRKCQTQRKYDSKTAV